ncbi:MAG: hypothetical protein IKQ43_07320 [Treponema sp.]|nr:hypothetical protein [Treponema sp.]MBR7080785.1 hypothetical protein [Treponema sp.]
MSQEMDVIEHLLEIEREASRTLVSAQAQADSQIAAARTKADEQFKKLYSEAVKGIEEKAQLAKKEITDNRQSSLDSYKGSLSSMEMDVEAFNSLLESYISQ